MQTDRIKRIIDLVGQSPGPSVEFIKRAEKTGSRLGIFASSFNPVTTAHIELMRRAARQFSLDETIALAGSANADKTGYECPLDDRLMMLLLAVADEPHLAVALSGAAYFVDMIEALERAYPPQTDLHFIVGFDTFERVLDRKDRYRPNYNRKFDSRGEALEYLFRRSRLIVAGRAGADHRHLHALIDGEPETVARGVFYLDTIEDLGERSASEVRGRVRSGLSIAGLAPPSVERYIQEQGLYKELC